MKNFWIVPMLVLGFTGVAQQKPTQKQTPTPEVVKQKQEQAEDEIRKSRAEKKAKLEAARKTAKERVNRDTVAMKKK